MSHRIVRVIFLGRGLSAFARVLIRCRSGWIVICFERNPYWFSYNILLLFMNDIVLLNMILSITFQKAGNMLTGR